MNTKYKFLVASSLGLTLLAGVALPVIAEDGGNATGTPDRGGKDRMGSSTEKFRGDADRGSKTKWDGDLSKLIERGDKEIDRRIAALQNQNDRIQSAKRVSDEGKSMIAGSIQSQIDILTVLKTKIDADTDEATLRTDLKSITASHRIFALVMPQAAITAAALRIETIAGNLATISGKLKTRITTAQAAGKDVTAVNTTLAHMNAQIADALVQAKAAKDRISGLVPDNGDKTKAEANRAALLAARADIKVGAADLRDARKDAETILKALKGFNSGDKKSDEETPSPSPTATSVATPTATPSPTTSPTATP
ncbi:MAG: hypothetical protein PHS53_04505 [Candidatus Pacebacteria bacterium]|nr:hypothetical protein [Candidatus Paceibacterota bacterium]MDD5357380.1 hypothetical protein [Candidatus Paceibacterota bacterium]